VRILIVILLALAPSAPAAQEAVVPLPPATGTARFEVASVRSNTSGAPPGGWSTKGRTFSAMNQPLRQIIALAYGIAGPASYRLVGGPEWIGRGGGPPFGTIRFDIVATLPEGTGARDVPAMLRALLSERFGLAVHTEIRAAPAYALRLARSDGRLGPQLRKAPIDCAGLAPEAVPPSKPGERGPCDSELGGAVLGRGQRIAALTNMLTPFVGRPVVDRTGLSGPFDFDLTFPELDAGPGGGGAANDLGGGVFTAVQEQLGLKLESAEASVEFLVIDRVEPPTAN
jgi:uncharacterized protein (TIGR03435 family)